MNRKENNTCRDIKRVEYASKEGLKCELKPERGKEIVNEDK